MKRQFVAGYEVQEKQRKQNGKPYTVYTVVLDNYIVLHPATHAEVHNFFADKGIIWEGIA